MAPGTSRCCPAGGLVGCGIAHAASRRPARLTPAPNQYAAATPPWSAIETGHGVAEADACGDDHRERSDRTAGLLAGEAVACCSHGEGHQRETEALESPAQDQERQRRCDRGNGSTEDDEREPPDDQALAVAPVAEPADERRYDGGNEEGGSQGPLGAADAHVQLLREARDQWRPETGDDCNDGADEEEDGDEGAFSKCRHLCQTIQIGCIGLWLAG